MSDNTPSTPQQVFKNFQITGLFYESVQDNIVALAGGGQTGATQITSEVARITTVATAGDSVALPQANPGLTIALTNHGAKAAQVYGLGADTINDVAAGTGVSHMIGSEVIYVATSQGKWYANGLGTGYSGSFETQSYADGLTAHAGGGQGSAWLITTMISRFTVVASAGDSAILPTSVAGMSITIINASANSMNVFPDTGSTINGSAANASYALAAGKTAQFVTTLAGAWHALLSA
jgi:hypothetical protein